MECNAFLAFDLESSSKLQKRKTHQKKVLLEKARYDLDTLLDLALMYRNRVYAL